MDFQDNMYRKYSDLKKPFGEFPSERFVLKSPEPKRLIEKVICLYVTSILTMFGPKATRSAWLKCSQNLYFRPEYMHEKLLFNILIYPVFSILLKKL